MGFEAVSGDGLSCDRQRLSRRIVERQFVDVKTGLQVKEVRIGLKDRLDVSADQGVGVIARPALGPMFQLLDRKRRPKIDEICVVQLPKLEVEQDRVLEPLHLELKVIGRGE